MAGLRRRLRWDIVVIFVLVLGMWEMVGPISYGYPGPVGLSYVALYNGVQSARTAVPNLTAGWRKRKAAGPPPDARVVAASNAMGFRILKRMAAENPGENLFFSPYSLSASLTMVADGAAGPTRRTMWRALGLDGITEETVNRSYNRLETLLDYTDPRVRVLSANSLWADDQAGLREDYARKVGDAFQAGVQAADLQSPEAYARIDRWISRHTDGKFGGLAPARHSNNALVLANALYFHGRWTNQFDKANTHPGRFVLEDGRAREVPMMSQQGAGIDVYGSGEDFAVFRLPYGDGSTSMVILLPDRYAGYDRVHSLEDDSSEDRPSLRKLVARMSPEVWDRSMAGLHRRIMGVAMPRFRFEGEPDVERQLKAEGFAPAFQRGADFSAMCSAPEGVYVSSIRQKAFLEVDEKGTRAGAITLHDMRTAGMPSSMRIDRPFLCAIRDDRTGLILFLGAIFDPEPLG